MRTNYLIIVYVGKNRLPLLFSAFADGPYDFFFAAAESRCPLRRRERDEDLVPAVEAPVDMVEGVFNN